MADRAKRAAALGFTALLCGACSISIAQTYLPPDVDVPSLRPTPCDGLCPIPIERAMREFQARNRYFGEADAVWPRTERSCPENGDGTDAPPFPPDGFYDHERCDAWKAAALVQDLLDKMNDGAPWLAYMVDPELEVPFPFPAEGVDSLPDQLTHPDGHDGMVLEALGGYLPDDPVTPENYCEIAERLDNFLRRLTDAVAGPDWLPAGDGADHDLEMIDGRKECSQLSELTRPAAYQVCTQGMILNTHADAPYSWAQKREYCHWCGGPGAWGILSVGTADGRGELRTIISKARGSLTEIVRLQPANPPDNTGIGESEVPVGGDDYRVYPFGQSPLPATWKRGFGRTPLKIQMEQDGQSTMLSPAEGDRGWQADRRWTVIHPTFDTAPDTAAMLGRGGCQGCGPGHVTYSRTDLSVKISLGMWDRGSAGYLLIRGDTLIGAGQEMFRRAQPENELVLGSGAVELGDPKGLVVCIDPIIRPVPKNPSSAYSLSCGNGDIFGVVNQRDQDQNFQYLRQLRFPQGLVAIAPLSSSSYQLTIYRNPGAYCTEPEIHYDLSNAEIVKTITISHHMEPLADDPDSADARDILVTGVLEIYDSSTDVTTRYKQIKKVRDWTVETDDPKNYSGNTPETREYEQIAEGFLPGTGPWYDTRPRLGTWRVDAVSGHSGPLIDLASVETSRVPGEGAGVSIETRITRDPNGAVMRKERLKTQSVAGAERTVERVVDPDGEALTTTWSYVVNSEGGARLLDSTQPSGVTQSFLYDSAGRLTQITSPLYTNQPNEPTLTRVESFSYLFDDLPNDSNWEFPPFEGADRELITTRSVVEGGHEVQRTYTVAWSAPPDDRAWPWSHLIETSTIRVANLEPVSDVKSFVAQVMSDPLASGHLVSHSASYYDPSELLNTGIGFVRNHGRTVCTWESDGSSSITNYEGWAPFGAHMGLKKSIRAGQRSAASPASPVSQMPVLADGTRTVTKFDHVGNTKLSQSFDMQGTTGDGDDDDDILISQREMTAWEYVDDPNNPGRPTRITYSDGTYEETIYDCCTVSERHDRDGVRTRYFFDYRHRLSSEISAYGSPTPVQTAYTYDALDRTLTTSRGPSGNSILQTQNTYDDVGRLVTTADALGAQTAYQEDMNGVGVTTTVTLPDPDGSGPLTSPTQITVGTSDGWQIESGGTAAHPVRYERGVELDATISASTWVTWQKEIRLGSQSETTEWVKHFSDPLGRNYKTVYADGATERSYFDARGRLVKQVDADGVVTLSRQGRGFESGLPGNAADWDGDWQVSCVDMDQDGVIDFNGTDRISRSVSTVLHSTDHGGGDFRRTTSSILTTDNNATSWLVIGQQDERVGQQDAATTGLQSWQTAFGQTVATVALVDRGNQKRTVRTTSPAGTVSESVNQYGRSAAARSYFAGGALHTESTTAYDVHGRVASTTDTRATQDTSDDRSVTYTYDNKDRVTAVTMTPAQTGGPPVVTSSTYDALDRVLTSTAADGAVQHFEYLPTGQVKKAWGGRSYPVEYTYDSQGRSKTLTTWQSFNFGTGQGTSGGATTTWTYSPTRGWLTTKAYQGQAGPTYDYWPSGRIKSRAWVRGITSNYTYTTGGELHQVNYSDTTPDVTYTYNRRGQVTAVTDGVGDRTLAYSDPGAMIDEDFTSGVLDPVHIQNTYDTLLRREHNTLQVNSTQVNDVVYGYDAASARLGSVGKDTNHRAEYAYTPGDDSLASTTFKVSNVTKATVTRAYDKLGRLTQIQSDSVTAPDEGFTYTYNDANQRTRVDLVDGTYWLYQYDSLGQVIGGKRYIDLPPAGPDGDILTPGEQFEYTFDHIGNRTQTKVGGNSAGQNLRTATYNRNLLNQYTSRTIPGTVDLLGFAPANNPVTFATPPGGTPVAADFRSGEFYQKALSWTNTLIARYEGVDIDTNGGGAPEETRWVFLPKTPENFTHDLDGNLLSDGKWLYTWDGENRLVAMETKSSLPVAMPAARLEFVYDYMSRRCVKRVYDHSAQGGTPNSGEPTVEGSASAVVQGGQPGSPEGGVIITPPGWTLVSTYKFVWDGWLLIAELDGQDAVVRTCAWGLDVSGSPGGAGGVGGLAFESLAATGATHLALYDGNGNLTSLRDDTGAISAAYEYGPFGETLTTRGSPAALSSNAFKFSTKYTDVESGLLYYGFRYYNQGTGRWLNRDPMEEQGGVALFGYVENDAVNSLDALGQKRIIVAFRGAGESWMGSITIPKYWKAALTDELGTDYEWFEKDHDVSGDRVVEQIVPKLTSIVSMRTGNDDAATECGYNSIILLGYSWGGQAAAVAASRSFRNEGIKVDLVFVADVVKGKIDSTLKRYPNVSRLVNYYQHQHSESIAGLDAKQFWGESISEADVNVELLKSDFAGANFAIARSVPGIRGAPGPNTTANENAANGHIYIGLNDKVLQSLREEVKKVPSLRSEYKHP